MEGGGRGGAGVSSNGQDALAGGDGLGAGAIRGGSGTGRGGGRASIGGRGFGYNQGYGNEGFFAPGFNPNFGAFPPHFVPGWGWPNQGTMPDLVPLATARGPWLDTACKEGELHTTGCSNRRGCRRMKGFHRTLMSQMFQHSRGLQYKIR